MLTPSVFPRSLLRILLHPYLEAAVSVKSRPLEDTKGPYDV